MAALAAALTLAGEASALTQFSLTLSGGPGFFTAWDNPTFSIVNTSTAGESITGLSITIGDTAFTFDQVFAAHPSEALTGATLLSPNRVNNDVFASNGTSDVLLWSFGDFDAGETLTFTAELDLDFALFGSLVDARWILFNNDDFIFFPDPNAVVTASFSDGSTASITLPDASPFASSYAYASGPGTGAGAVPEPNAFLLVGIGLLGLAWLGEPRRPAAP